MPPSLRAYIRDDLSAAIRSGRRLPDAWTLDALAARYGVSTTPVRQALNDLLRERLLRRDAEGQLTPGARRGKRIPKESRGPILAAFPGDTAADRVEHTLCEEIIAAALRGDDAYLREEATAARFDVSRTVIRQVFERLDGRGLLVHRPRRGWQIRGLQPAEMHDYLRAREALELAALEQAIPHLQADDLQRLLAANTGRGRGGARRINNDLHQYIVERSGNRYIQDFFARHGAYYDSLFNYAAPEARVVQQMADQHCAILRALLTNDLPAARKELRRHIRAQQEIVERLISEPAAGAG